MNITENKTFDEERAFYGKENIKVVSCRFDGPADGESAFKECRGICVDNCFFNLRYPFWHDENVEIKSCQLTHLCRAALWYSKNISISFSDLLGIKALRECKDVTMNSCRISSPEFGWSSSFVSMKNCIAESEYFMLRATHLDVKELDMKGKYSFQYIEDSVFDECNFDTKDAFWHAKNVTVKNSVIKGEYLGWYCENVTFINCEIIGTQPLCYCKDLKLINCRMIDTDLSFEKSEVNATLTGHIESIKNPLKGEIIVPSVGKVIMDDEKAEGKIIIKA